MRLTRVLLLGGLLATIILSGCASDLETGYKPRRLSATSDVRRSYYAAPFTAEATPATTDKGSGETGVRKPGSY
jgi:hypothetical protein